MISTIIFDLGGVLVDIDFKSFLKTLAQHYEISEKELIKYKSIEIHEDYMKGLLTSEHFYSSILPDFDKKLSCDQFKQLWNSILIGQKDDTAEIVEKLDNRYNLALMSNIDPWHFSFCYENYPIIRKFENRFLSYELHSIKPERDFYLHVTKILNTETHHCLFIDDLVENIKTAQDLGFNTIHFKNGLHLKNELIKLNII